MGPTVDGLLSMVLSLSRQLDEAALAKLRRRMGPQQRSAVWLRIPPVPCDLAENDGPEGEITRTTVFAVRLRPGWNIVDLLHEGAVADANGEDQRLFSSEDVCNELDRLRLRAAILDSPYPVTRRRITQARVDGWAAECAAEQERLEEIVRRRDQAAGLL